MKLRFFRYVIFFMFVITFSLFAKDKSYNARMSKKYSAESREKKMSIVTLNNLLANTSVMMMQTLNYHWNLSGPEFNDYHKLLNEQYKMLFADMDLIAERVRAIGGHAFGSMYDMLNHATMNEDSSKIVPKSKQMIKNLLSQYNYQIEHLRIAIDRLEKSHDHGTKKMLEDLIEKYEKTAWKLRSLLGK